MKKIDVSRPFLVRITPKLNSRWAPVLQLHRPRRRRGHSDPPVPPRPRRLEGLGRQGHRAQEEDEGLRGWDQSTPGRREEDSVAGGRGQSAVLCGIQVSLRDSFLCLVIWLIFAKDPFTHFFINYVFKYWILFVRLFQVERLRGPDWRSLHGHCRGCVQIHITHICWAELKMSWNTIAYSNEWFKFYIILKNDILIF